MPPLLCTHAHLMESVNLHRFQRTSTRKEFWEIGNPYGFRVPVNGTGNWHPIPRNPEPGADSVPRNPLENLFLRVFEPAVMLRHIFSFFFFKYSTVICSSNRRLFYRTNISSLILLYYYGWCTNTFHGQTVQLNIYLLKTIDHRSTILLAFQIQYGL